MNDTVIVARYDSTINLVITDKRITLIQNARNICGFIFCHVPRYAIFESPKFIVEYNLNVICSMCYLLLDYKYGILL